MRVATRVVIRGDIEFSEVVADFQPQFQVLLHYNVVFFVLYSYKLSVLPAISDRFPKLKNIRKSLQYWENYHCQTEGRFAGVTR